MTDHGEPVFLIAGVQVIAEYFEHGGVDYRGYDIPEDCWSVEGNAGRGFWHATTDQITEYYEPISVGAYRELRMAGADVDIPEEIKHVLEEA